MLWRGGNSHRGCSGSVDYGGYRSYGGVGYDRYRSYGCGSVGIGGYRSGGSVYEAVAVAPTTQTITEVAGPENALSAIVSVTGMECAPRSGVMAYEKLVAAVIGVAPDSKSRNVRFIPTVVGSRSPLS